MASNRARCSALKFSVRGQGMSTDRSSRLAGAGSRREICRRSDFAAAFAQARLSRTFLSSSRRPQFFASRIQRRSLRDVATFATSRALVQGISPLSTERFSLGSFFSFSARRMNSKVLLREKPRASLA